MPALTLHVAFYMLKIGRDAVIVDKYAVLKINGPHQEILKLFYPFIRGKCH